MEIFLIYQLSLCFLLSRVITANDERNNNFTILYDDDDFRDQMESSQRQELRNVNFVAVRKDVGLQSLVTMNSQANDVYFSFGEKITLMHDHKASLIDRRIDFKDSIENLVYSISELLFFRNFLFSSLTYANFLMDS